MEIRPYCWQLKKVNVIRLKGCECCFSKMLELSFDVVTGSENLMRLLIENGGDVNAADQEGRTALIYAALNGNSHGRVFYVHAMRDATSKCFILLTLSVC